MRPGDVRDKSGDELTRLAAQLEEEIFRLRFRSGAGQLKQSANIRKSRRDLARVNTIIREREIAGAKGGA